MAFTTPIDQLLTEPYPVPVLWESITNFPKPLKMPKLNGHASKEAEQLPTVALPELELSRHAGKEGEELSIQPYHLPAPFELAWPSKHTVQKAEKSSMYPLKVPIPPIPPLPDKYRQELQDGQMLPKGFKKHLEMEYSERWEMSRKQSQVAHIMKSMKQACKTKATPIVVDLDGMTIETLNAMPTSQKSKTMPTTGTPTSTPTTPQSLPHTLTTPSAQPFAMLRARSPYHGPTPSAPTFSKAQSHGDKNDGEAAGEKMATGEMVNGEQNDGGDDDCIVVDGSTFRPCEMKTEKASTMPATETPPSALPAPQLPGLTLITPAGAIRPLATMRARSPHQGPTPSAPSFSDSQRKEDKNDGEATGGKMAAGEMVGGEDDDCIIADDGAAWNLAQKKGGEVEVGQPDFFEEELARILTAYLAEHSETSSKEALPGHMPGYMPLWT